MKGRKHTKEAIEKMRLAHRGAKANSGSFKKGMASPKKIERHLISCACGCGRTLVNMSVWGKRRQYVHGHNIVLHNTPTSIEVKVYDELKRRGFLFETQKVIKGKFRVDAYIPGLNLVVEADGDYWHSLPKNIRRDKAKDAYLGKCGFGLLRLSETEIKSGKFTDKLDELEVNSRSHLLTH
jgi:very-short-patch-repair endonuclease